MKLPSAASVVIDAPPALAEKLPAAIWQVIGLSATLGTQFQSAWKLLA